MWNPNYKDKREEGRRSPMPAEPLQLPLELPYPDRNPFPSKPDQREEKGKEDRGVWITDI